MVLSRYQLSLTGILNVATTFWSAISYDINAIFSRRTYVPHPPSRALLHRSAFC